MDNTPWYKKAEMIIGLSALLVSLVAVFVGVYSAYIDRTFARASIWPRLEIGTLYSNEQKRFIYILENVGTGPALIQHTKVSFNGKPVQDWASLIGSLGFAHSFSQTDIRQRLMPALSKIRPIESENAELAEALHANKHNIVIEVCYCSVYEACWTVKGSDTVTEVDECRIAQNERFLE